jgi:hypothetical protein
MRIASMRVVSAVVVASLTVTCLSPLAQAQDVVGAAESTPLEQAEQPMAPPVRADEPAPPADPTVAQVQPAPPPVMPPPPAPPAAVTPPAMQPAHPDLFQETLKAQQPGAGKAVLYGTGAVVTNIFLIPGRVITCALGGGLGVAVLAITFGTGYKAAASVWDEGCGGKWVVSGDDLRPEGSRAFDWER